MTHYLQREIVLYSYDYYPKRNNLWGKNAHYICKLLQ